MTKAKSISLTNIKRILKGSVPNGGMIDKTVELSLIGGSASRRQVCVPDGNDSYSGTIRSHEGRHLSFSPIATGEVSTVPRKWLEHPLMERCVQISEDCYIETRPLAEDCPESYKRMHRDAANKDLADLLALDTGDKESFAAKVLVSARIRAMQIEYGTGAAEQRKLFKLLPHLIKSVSRAVNYAQAGQRAEAALMLFKILGGKLSEIDEIESEQPKTEEEKEQAKLDKATEETARSTIEGKRSVMQIIELRRTLPTKAEKEPVFRTCYPDSGSRINTVRLVNAMVSGDARGVFMQNLTEQRGESTLLIDASGSMEISAEVLATICMTSPNATVAYYCGTDNEMKPEGWLYVYAKDKRRYDGEIDIPCGGNSVDLPALEWAMRQHGPITLVSDLGFCGCSQGEIAEAHGLVERLLASGRLTVLHDVRQALASLLKTEGR